MSRSVAGSYDNEAVAIWALTNTFFLWIRAVNTGSVIWSVACTLQYFYMVSAWGGYSFIINLIPAFVLGVIFIGKFNLKIYVAYSIFYTLGSLMAMLILIILARYSNSVADIDANNAVKIACQIALQVKFQL